MGNDLVKLLLAVVEAILGIGNSSFELSNKILLHLIHQLAHTVEKCGDFGTLGLLSLVQLAAHVLDIFTRPLHLVAQVRDAQLQRLSQRERASLRILQGQHLVVLPAMALDDTFQTQIPVAVRTPAVGLHWQIVFFAVLCALRNEWLVHGVFCHHCLRFLEIQTFLGTLQARVGVQLHLAERAGPLLVAVPAQFMGATAEYLYWLCHQAVLAG